MIMVADYGMWVLGDNFMQGYYTIFDQSALRVGLVAAKSYGDLTGEDQEDIQTSVSYTNKSYDNPLSEDFTSYLGVWFGIMTIYFIGIAVSKNCKKDKVE
jgi:hypothetical protein